VVLVATWQKIDATLVWKDGWGGTCGFLGGRRTGVVDLINTDQSLTASRP
jgi:hypothetical protein